MTHKTIDYAFQNRDKLDNRTLTSSFTDPGNLSTKATFVHSYGMYETNIFLSPYCKLIHLIFLKTLYEGGTSIVFI